MRHRNSGRKFSRTAAHRKALFRNMATALLTYGRITTTEAKAKELRGVVDPLITLSRKNDLHARREAYRHLGNHQLVKRLFDEIGPTFAGLDGGYTRVVKLALPRKGDNAPMAILELTRGKHIAEEKADAKAPATKEAKPAEKPKKAKSEGEAPAPKKPRAKKTETPAEPVADAPAAE